MLCVSMRCDAIFPSNHLRNMCNQRRPPRANTPLNQLKLKGQQNFQVQTSHLRELCQVQTSHLRELCTVNLSTGWFSCKHSASPWLRFHNKKGEPWHRKSTSIEFHRS
ncbi:hypothetical protein D1007_06068 [Hordeum vulgare]|nr:hypothetical protein D1007_06068 [Hordeum vulgare]